MTKRTIGKKFLLKRQARKIVFSALYAQSITGGAVSLQSITSAMQQPQAIDIDYAQSILNAYHEDAVQVNQYIDTYAQLEKRTGNTEVERAILQMATAELIHSDLPHKVVINEAIEITKEYGAGDGYKFINAVLDKIAKALTGA